MYRRNVAHLLEEALEDRPIVLLGGARQTGKSTLVQQLVDGGRSARYLTLDDAAVLSACRDDPQGFVDGLDEPVVLDEVQRAPELLLALKRAVDRKRTPGRFLLTGSANVLLLPQASDSLAGRMEVFTLWPLSQGELEGQQEGFVDALFSGALRHKGKGEARASTLERVLKGGYPEPLGLSSVRRRDAWFGSYLTALLQRDVRDLANVDGLTAFPRLLALLAARVGSVGNAAEISRSLQMPLTTLKRYLSLLEMTFLLQPLPAWSGNLSRRLVKAPKLFLGDTGLAAHLQGISSERLVNDPTLSGPLLENFVVSEIRKQVAWSETRPSLFHFRTHAGQEVDLVMEDRAGRLVGVEVKASSSVSGDDFKGLRSFGEAVGKRFVGGVVLHLGQEAVPFGEKLHALPMTALWKLGARPNEKRS